MDNVSENNHIIFSNERDKDTSDRAARFKTLTLNQRIILSHKWRLDKEDRILLDGQQFFWCPITTFVKKMKQREEETWRYDFTCKGSECNHYGNPEMDCMFSINYFFTSASHLFDLYDDALDNPRDQKLVSFILRRNAYNKWYSCLVKVNDDEWSSEKLSRSWAQFPVKQAVKKD